MVAKVMLHHIVPVLSMLCYFSSSCNKTLLELLTHALEENFISMNGMRMNLEQFNVWSSLCCLVCPKNNEFCDKTASYTVSKNDYHAATK